MRRRKSLPHSPRVLVIPTSERRELGGICCPLERQMVRQRTYYVYIMASISRVIYVGVTGLLMARVLRHRTDEGGAGVHAEIPRAPPGIFSHLPQHRGRDRALDRDQEVAAREESRSD
jgi:predicted GIY-YIG superfamily endonuclease